ncbi:MAG TPA: EAL domain-containing protein [Aestuariivirga sp.]|nr:EAL domain-containing protein [Aestuariivirga sp.]
MLANKRPTSLPDPDTAEHETLIKIEQLDTVARLSTLSVITLFTVVLALTWLFWSPANQNYFIGLGAAGFVVAALALWSNWRWIHSDNKESLTRGTMLLATVLALAGGIVFASVPIRLFLSASLQERLLVVSIIAGVLSTGITLAAAPRIAFAFVAPVAAGSFWALITSGEHNNILLAFLLVIYASFLALLSLYLSRLVRSRAVDRINLHRERALTAILLRDFEDNATDWLWETDHDLRFVHVPDRIVGMTNLPKGSLQGQNLITLIERVVMPDSRTEMARISQLVEERKSFRDVMLHICIGSQERWWLISGKPAFNRNEKFTGYRGVGTDTTDKKKAEDKLHYLALHDGMTNLANRALFLRKLQEAQANLQDIGKFAVMCLDLDEFKAVNDAFGHGSGDALLVQVANRMRSLLNPDICVARLAGDEFAILVTGEEECRRDRLSDMGQAIIEAMSYPFQLDAVSAHIGVSIGLAVAPEDGVEEVMRRADLALYQSKRQGKNTMHFYQSDMDEVRDARRMLAADLRAALSKGEFVLHYQPMVHAVTRKVQGFEALVRWQHKPRGLVPPAEFIPLAEETGIIVPMGEWIIREACRVAQSWPMPLRLAVNLSPVQFRHSDLPSVVERALRDSGLDPGRLELELTESAFLEETEETELTLQRLRALGVLLSLDDFGTGYSSLSYLRRISFDKVKIDRSFVKYLPEDARDLSIVRAVVDIASNMGMSITAEGVETDEQSRCLLQQGCHQLQGYLFSKPVTLDEAMSMMRAMQTQPEAHTAAAV